MQSTDDLLDGDGLVDEDKVHAPVEDLVRCKPRLTAFRHRHRGAGSRPETPEIGLARDAASQCLIRPGGLRLEVYASAFTRTP